MTASLKDMMAGLAPARRRKIEDRAAELIAEEMTLRELRKARKLTQVSVARELDCDEDEGRFNETLKRIAPKKDETPGEEG